MRVGIVSGLKFFEDRLNGRRQLVLMKTQGKGQPFKHVASVTLGFYLGSRKDMGTGAIKDALFVEENETLTEEILRMAEDFDLVDLTTEKVFRYHIESKTPPRRKHRRWVLIAKANFADTTAMVM